MRPSVTVAIPLHRSAPFVDIVLANIAAIDLPDAEIVVSDRTLEDDAAARIAAATADDPRVEVVASADGLTWVEHHAALLDRATGPYVTVMSHDDDFGSAWVRGLVGALDADRGAMVAFGDLRIHGTDRVVRTMPPPRHPRAEGRPAASDAARQLTYWHIAIAYSGVFRTDALREHQLRLGAGGPKLERADDLFMFEVALCGRLLHVPGTTFDKRFHEASTHIAFSTSPSSAVRFHLSALRALAERGRDRTVPWAAVIVLRRLVGFLVMDTRRRFSGRR